MSIGTHNEYLLNQFKNFKLTQDLQTNPYQKIISPGKKSQTKFVSDSQYQIPTKKSINKSQSSVKYLFEPEQQLKQQLIDEINQQKNEIKDLIEVIEELQGSQLQKQPVINDQYEQVENYYYQPEFENNQLQLSQQVEQQQEDQYTLQQIREDQLFIDRLNSQISQVQQQPTQTQKSYSQQQIPVPTQIYQDIPISKISQGPQQYSRAQQPDTTDQINKIQNILNSQISRVPLTFTNQNLTSDLLDSMTTGEQLKDEQIKNDQRIDELLNQCERTTKILEGSLSNDEVQVSNHFVVSYNQRLKDNQEELDRYKQLKDQREIEFQQKWSHENLNYNRNKQRPVEVKIVNNRIEDELEAEIIKLEQEQEILLQNSAKKQVYQSKTEHNMKSLISNDLQKFLDSERKLSSSQQQFKQVLQQDYNQIVNQLELSKTLEHEQEIEQIRNEIEVVKQVQQQVEQLNQSHNSSYEYQHNIKPNYSQTQNQQLQQQQLQIQQQANQYHNQTIQFVQPQYVDKQVQSDIQTDIQQLQSAVQKEQQFTHQTLKKIFNQHSKEFMIQLYYHLRNMLNKSLSEFLFNQVFIFNNFTDLNQQIDQHQLLQKLLQNCGKFGPVFKNYLLNNLEVQAVEFYLQVVKRLSQVFYKDGEEAHFPDSLYDAAVLFLQYEEQILQKRLNK